MTLIGRLGYLSCAVAAAMVKERQMADNKLATNRLMRAVREFVLPNAVQKGASNKSVQERPSSFIAASLREIEDIVRISVGCYAGYASGLNITRDNVKLILDHCAGETMARDAHARKALVPSVRSWIIGLECP